MFNLKNSSLLAFFAPNLSLFAQLMPYRAMTRSGGWEYTFLMQCYLVDDADFIRSLRSTLGNFAKPDECPPRQTDTVQDGINGQKRTCPRKCASDSDCLNDRKLCLCDGACGLSCIRPEKECPELPDPPHGQVISKSTFSTYLVLYNMSSATYFQKVAGKIK